MYHVKTSGDQNRRCSLTSGASEDNRLRISASSRRDLMMDVDDGWSPEDLGGSASGPLDSASVLTFGADNVLFVGDITGAAVYAFALRPSDTTSQHDVELGNFHNFEGRDLVTDLDQKLAGLLGTTYDQVAVNDLAVHQPSQQIFLAVERGRSTDAVPAIIKVNHGQLEVLDLSGIPHTSVAISNVPSPDAGLEFDAQRSFAITDITYYDGEIFVSGVSNQRFASTLHRIRYPFTSHMSTSTVEI
jgi:hypothetical protein